MAGTKLKVAPYLFLPSFLPMSGDDARISAPTRAILKALRHSKKYVSFYVLSPSPSHIASD